MAIFHIVPLGVSSCISKMDYRACFKISKLSKNYLNTFVVRENRMLEVGKNSLGDHGQYMFIQVAKPVQTSFVLNYGSLNPSTLKN